MVGGVTRSELRVAHALAARTGRDITLGSTSIETPASFLQRVQVRPPQPYIHPCITLDPTLSATLIHALSI